jgi:hypothetical protein
MKAIDLIGRVFGHLQVATSRSCWPLTSSRAACGRAAACAPSEHARRSPWRGPSADVAARVQWWPFVAELDVAAEVGGEALELELSDRPRLSSGGGVGMIALHPQPIAYPRRRS